MKLIDLFYKKIIQDKNDFSEWTHNYNYFL